MSLSENRFPLFRDEKALTPVFARYALSRNRRLARKWRDPQRRDPVALAPQDAKTETVEGEGLAGFRDRPRFVDHQTRDRGRLGVGQTPIHGAVEIADRHPAVHVDRAVGLRA